MALFARRDIQHMLDESKKFLDDTQRSLYIQQLQDEKNLAMEWEISILASLSTLGELRHEEGFQGTRKPDIYLSIRYGDKEYVVIADITTISDEGIERKNKYELFHKELNRIISKHKLDPNKFSVKIDGELPVQNFNYYGKRKERNAHLLLNGYQKVLQKDFESFLRNIENKPNSYYTHKFTSNKCSFEVNYDFKQRYQTLYMPSYKTICSIEKNPLTNALNDKRTQLKGCGEKGVKGIIICDGACEVLSKKNSQSGYSQKEIINKFMQGTSTVDFVLTICPMCDNFNDRKLKIEVFSKNRDSYLVANLVRNTLIDKLPIPVRSAMNARYILKYENRDFGYILGGYSMCDNKIEMSARLAVQVLAGVANKDELMHDYNDVQKMLQRLLSEGRTIKNISIKYAPSLDDELVVIEFDKKTDPAISPYHL